MSVTNHILYFEIRCNTYCLLLPFLNFSRRSLDCYTCLHKCEIDPSHRSWTLQRVPKPLEYFDLAFKYLWQNIVAKYCKELKGLLQNLIGVENWSLSLNNANFDPAHFVGWQTSLGHKRWILVDTFGWIFVDTFYSNEKSYTIIQQ